MDGRVRLSTTTSNIARNTVRNKRQTRGIIKKKGTERDVEVYVCACIVSVDERDQFLVQYPQVVRKSVEILTVFSFLTLRANVEVF
jgi:hypothetical protein